MEEIYLTIPEAINYEVSNLGNVRNKRNKYVLKGRLCKNGYLQVSVRIDAINKQQNRYIHRLVAQCFIPNSENKKEVNHKDGNKQNNIISNLEWVTPSENQKHRHSIGIRKTSNRRVGKFDLDGNLIVEYGSIVEAAQAEGRPRVSIDNVLQGRNKTLFGYIWKHLD